MGPPGGDVRTLGKDPQYPSRLYLGTPDGHIFISEDAGDRWQLLGRVSNRLDAVVTAILVDPRQSQILYASTWTRDPSAGSGGGVFRSDDGGRNWISSGLAGQAVRALTQAPSNPDVLVAGTLEGVFASHDAGATWERISPESNRELRNIDSLAVDPRSPEVIYAGTFHLPWKTSDGGRTWTSVHRGMIDDSDVMSILVDRSNPRRIYASSCSGIYRSDDSASRWQKVQGIPYSARRTHVITQDSARPQVIYAGTTEGLWKSENAGMSWRRVTPAQWVINAVELPANRPGRVVIGTDDLGILVSDDGGSRFRASNEGFHHRRMLALALDPNHPGRVLAVLANGPDPLLVTDDGGQSWKPLGRGLSRTHLKRVFASPTGWWAALAGGGLMRYDAVREQWLREGLLAGAAAAPSAVARRPARSASRRRTATPVARALGWVVNDMAFSETRWFAASDRGLLVSEDHGQHWQVMPLGQLPDLPVASVRVSRDSRSLWVVSLRGLVFSTNGGRNWIWRDLPLSAGGALRLEIAPDLEEGRTLVAMAHKGLFISRDAGATWQQAASGLPQTPVEDLAVVGNVFVASPRVGGLYLSLNSGRTWNRLPGTIAEGFFPAVAAEEGGAAVLAASASDGVYSLGFHPVSAAVTSPLPEQ
jgi:photosystem II stability/assembly factor-like uncharacterized protein